MQHKYMGLFWYVAWDAVTQKVWMFECVWKPPVFVGLVHILMVKMAHSFVFCVNIIASGGKRINSIGIVAEVFFSIYNCRVTGPNVLHTKKC